MEQLILALAQPYLPGRPVLKPVDLLCFLLCCFCLHLFFQFSCFFHLRHLLPLIPPFPSLHFRTQWNLFLRFGLVKTEASKISSSCLCGLLRLGRDLSPGDTFSGGVTCWCSISVVSSVAWCKLPGPFSLVLVPNTALEWSLWSVMFNMFEISSWSVMCETPIPVLCEAGKSSLPVLCEVEIFSPSVVCEAGICSVLCEAKVSPWYLVYEDGNSSWRKDEILAMRDLSTPVLLCTWKLMASVGWVSIFALFRAGTESQLPEGSGKLWTTGDLPGCVLSWRSQWSALLLRPLFRTYLVVCHFSDFGADLTSFSCWTGTVDDEKRL